MLFDIHAVHANQEYGINETRRDDAVAQTLEAQGIEFHRYLDQPLFQPGSILTQSGSYFQVFSQFRRICYNRLHMAMPALVTALVGQTPFCRLSAMSFQNRLKVLLHRATHCRRSGLRERMKPNAVWQHLPTSKFIITRMNGLTRQARHQPTLYLPGSRSHFTALMPACSTAQ